MKNREREKNKISGETGFYISSSTTTTKTNRRKLKN